MSRDTDEQIDVAMLWVLRAFAAMMTAFAIALAAATFGLGPMVDECPQEEVAR